MSKYIFEASKSGDITVKYNGKYIHSKYNPKKEGEAWASANYCENENILIFGIGLGYHITAIIPRLKPYQTLYIMDISEELYGYAKENSLINTINTDSIIPIISQNISIVKANLSEILSLGNISFLVYKPSLEALRDMDMELFNAIDGYNLSVHSIDYFKDALRENKEKNLSYGHENALRKFAGLFHGKTAIVVGAGASIKNDIHILKDFKDSKRGYIVAVGRIAADLCSMGIVPDFIMATDPQEAVMNPIRNVRNTEIPLLFISTCHYSVNEYEGEKYILYTNTEDDCLTVETGGSVATMSIDFCKKLGAKAIVLSGVDLCYSGETTHFGSNEFEASKSQLLLCNDGNEYPTNRQMSHYKRWIEHYISKNKDVKFYTLAYKGARFNGCTFIHGDDFKKLWLNSIL